MSSTKDYLSKYLSKPSSSSTDDYRKKKKKKSLSSKKTSVRKGNFAIHDEDEVSWKNADSESEDDYLPVVEETKAPTYKSNSSNWETIREGEPQQPQRNAVPEWDDVENEDERPAIAGVVVETESMARLRAPKAVKKSSKPIEKWKQTSQQDSEEHSLSRQRSRERSFSPVTRKRSRSPSPWSSTRDSGRGGGQRGRPNSRSPSPYNGRSHQRPFSSRSPSPKRRNRSLSSSPPRSRSPRSMERNKPVVGLQMARDGKHALEQKKREEEERIRALDPSKSGRDAETVYRDAQGRKIDRVQEKIEKAEAAKRELEKQEKMMEWGRGLVQREEEQERKKREQEEKHKPLARYKDDEDMNEELMERERWNDPAAKFLTGARKSKKKSAPKFPQYQGSFPPNRFNIPPGYRWDGVDRSNGFEKDYFARMNSKRHNAMEAHMWSTEDM
ncbi:Pre-mRNA-splicing factor cwc26 [Gryganskiella cystojenkinii]|nr:Pre-mRNA-splicing factor cwc26 [Gryganskiella cystojenkinii]